MAYDPSLTPTEDTVEDTEKVEVVEQDVRKLYNELGERALQLEEAVLRYNHCREKAQYFLKELKGCDDEVNFQSTLLPTLHFSSSSSFSPLFAQLSNS